MTPEKREEYRKLAAIHGSEHEPAVIASWIMGGPFGDVPVPLSPGINQVQTTRGIATVYNGEKVQPLMDADEH